MAAGTIRLTRNDFIDSANKAVADKLTVSQISDIDLVAEDGRCVGVHKIVIAAGSAYFQNIVSEQTLNSQVYVQASFSDLCLIVRFLYSGKCDVELDKLGHFLSIAKQLQIEGLCHEEPDLSEETVTSNRENVDPLLESTEKDEIEEKPDIIIAQIEENESKSTKDITSLKTYIAKAEEVKQNFCIQCNEFLSTENKLKKHMLRHSSNKPHLCQQCQIGLSSIEELDIHKMGHTSNKNMPYKCSDCIRSFASKEALKKHIARMHSGTETYGCDLCSHYKPSSYEDLQFHMIGHNTSEERPFKCEMCPKTFKKGSVLKMHIVNVHDKRDSYCCAQCGKSFNFEHGLKRHIMLHTGERPLACQFCPKTFAQSNSLNYHLRRHNGEKPYTCPNCPRTFTDSSSLRLHKRMHEGIKPFICELCSKSFYASTALKTHFLCNHSTEKPHVCEECSTSFKIKANLKRHTLLKHKVSATK